MTTAGPSTALRSRRQHKKSTNGKGSMLFTWSLYLCRRRPTLPHTFACSTIGPAGLNFRVRDGNGCFPRGKITGNLRRFAGPGPKPRNLVGPLDGTAEEAAEKRLKQVNSAFCATTIQRLTSDF